MGPWVWVRSSNKRLNRSVLYVGDVMTDLIKRDDALAAIDTFKRDFEQSWKVQFSADIKALPAIDPAAIREAALREAADVCLKSADNFYDPDEDGAWEARSNANTILALIGETK